MSYPTTGLQGIVGFAQAGGVTGGINGTFIGVSTVTDLASALSGSQPATVVLQQSLSADQLTKVQFGSNKSLLGSFGGNNVLHNIHLRATEDSSNVIFQNLVFSHDQAINGNDDIQVYLNYGQNYWLDHVTWQGHAWSSDDNSLDKLLYVGDYATYVTISNSLFQNHKYGCIFGHPADDNDTSYIGYPRLTAAFNRYENIEVRSPGLMRYGYYHAYNNYVNNFNLAYTISQNADVVSEHNYFGAGAELGGLVDDKNLQTKFTDIGSIPTVEAPLSPAADWTPGSNYDYDYMTAEEARVWAEARSGAQTDASNFRFPSF